MRKTRHQSFTRAITGTNPSCESANVRDGQISPVVVRAFRSGTRSARSVASDTADEHSRLVNQLARQLVDLHKLIARIASDEFSAAECESLRRLASQDGMPRVFELSNYLYRCRGERIRSLLKPSEPMQKVDAHVDSVFNE
jgi:hypothetical protein